jgi:hypothetical protein
MALTENFRRNRENRERGFFMKCGQTNYSMPSYAPPPSYAPTHCNTKKHKPKKPKCSPPPSYAPAPAPKKGCGCDFSYNPAPSPKPTYQPSYNPAPSPYQGSAPSYDCNSCFQTESLYDVKPGDECQQLSHGHKYAQSHHYAQAY